MKKEQSEKNTSQSDQVIFTSPSDGAQFPAGSAIHLVASNTLTGEDLAMAILTVNEHQLASGYGSIDERLSLAEGTYRAVARAYMPVGEGTYVDSLGKTFTVHNGPGTSPSVSIVEPAPASSHVEGTIAFNASVRIPENRRVTRVEFNLLKNAEFFAKKELLSAPYSFDLSLEPGVYEVLADLIMDDGAVSSSRVTFAVTGSVVPSIELVSPVNGTEFTRPESVSLRAIIHTDRLQEVKEVKFVRGFSTLIATVPKETPEYSWQAPSGNFTVKAVLVLTNGQEIPSNEASITVKPYAFTLNLFSPVDGEDITVPTVVPLRVRLEGGLPEYMKELKFFQGHNGLPIGDAVPVSDGVFGFDWEVQRPNGEAISIYARAILNDPSYLERYSNTVRVAFVSGNPTGINLISPEADEVFVPTDTVSLKAELIGGGAGAVDHVTFSIGERSEQVDTPAADGTYEFDWTGLTEGRHEVSAVATLTDGSPDLESTVTINVAGEINIVSPKNDEFFELSDTVPLKAELIGGAAGIVESVHFLVGAGETAPVTQPVEGVYETEWENVAPGRHEIVAVATLTGGKTLPSEPVYIQVSGGIDLTSPKHGERFNLSRSIELRAELAEGVPVGEVEQVRFVYATTLIHEMPGNGTGIYEHSWLPGVADRYTDVRVIAYLKDGNRHRSRMGVHIRVNTEEVETVELLSPEAEQVFLPSGTLRLRARLIGGIPGAVRHVKFSVGGELTGEAVDEGDDTYTFNLEGLSPGRNEVFAVATLAAGGEIPSEPVYIQVSGGVELTSPKHGAQFGLSERVELSARLTEEVPVGEVEQIRFVYGSTLIHEMPGTGADTYEHSWLPGVVGRYEDVRVIAHLRDGNRHRSHLGVHIRVNEA